ncbi:MULTISPECIES: flagellar hook-associated protein FlgL [Tenebrionibacter/Tenebrionicola group]|jgi:flagellar hook-associated protein 3 FlgL|uniref:Flagellar hook-associated protein FlgL n=2 Tax=Tenebrionibacter/Tenebrionicola group TaxID=2969848 RepID=A0A8K0XWI9_9ENTR|nr:MULTISPECIES: flagellar hook-associated protein FlgL [Tenebrionibacter/Tenebrionicola group]MBK4715440.1 flagellar hook-associated protein FlgL [Tenebrionibacter intestinalis]MBV5096108.1 flagellar hook-associated protein FlgL [Tenebrionicola larvae]
MRLSTHFMYQSNIDSLSNAMIKGNDIYTRLAAGKTLLTPSDDPAAASLAIALQNSIARSDQYATARMFAQDKLGQEDNALSSLSNLMTKNLAEKIVAGGNGAYSDADREALATELEGIRDNMLDIANTKDSNGRYIFSGYKTDTQPFNKDGSYQGGDTAMSQNVADSTEMKVGHTGDDVFMSGTDDDIFAQLDKAIEALRKPVESDEDRKALQDVLDSTNVSIKKGIDNLGRVQAEVGTNLQQLETLGFSADTQDIALQTRLQQTVGSDSDTLITMVAASQMSQFSLSASMMVFQSMQSMSLFNMVR